MTALDRTVWPEHAIVHHGRNETGGRDLVAGDIHGYFDTLEHALDKLGFDPGADRLFAVGDLVDRGPRSAAALEWLAADRIAAVRGNHDQGMVDALVLDHGKLYPSGHSELWAQIGGQWWYDLPNDGEEAIEQRRRQWLTALRRVPFARTLETFNGQRIGIVHTLELANDWSSLEAMLKHLAHEAEINARSAHSAHAYHTLNHLPHEILWGRPQIECEAREDTALPAPMREIDLVLIGHTPGREARWTRRNVLCIDTGVHIPEHGHLTIAEVQTAPPRLHRFAR